jgi:integrase
MLAIGAFAGLRDAEIKRLDWSEVDLTRGFIEVTAAKAKSARRRIVAIQPNLAEWLRPFSGRTGKVAPHDSLKRIDTAFDAANLSHWPKNGLRHSLASYRYAATNDAALVASGLGHTTTAMLFNTYRELVTPEEATRYFAIAPAAAAANVVAFAS